MIQKQDLKKITDYLYEIPKTGKMNVPAMIYVKEKMLEKVLADRSLEQAVNVATLPGIYKYSLAMPDIHQGYGFPIGGVAAFKMEQGIISPGGIGYDINCTPAETKVILFHHTWLPIKNMTKKFSPPIISLNKKQSLKQTTYKFLLERQEKNKLFLIKNEFGDVLKVTADHPVLTEKGMKKAENLVVGDKIPFYPFLGIKYTPPKNKIIVDLKKVKDILKRTLKRTSGGNTLKQTINSLEKHSILPIKENSSQLPYLLKILGYIYGDGMITFINQRKGIISFYGRKEDLKTIRNDIKKINFQPSPIYCRERHHKVTTYYKKEYQFIYREYSFRISNTGLAALLGALGAPFGNKTKTPFTLPAWIFQLPSWQKRLFLAAFFGAEMSLPKTSNAYEHNFYTPTLNINKGKNLAKNGQQFLRQIIRLLKEWGINCSRISLLPQLGSKKTIGLRFQIKSNIKNLKKFFQLINFEYHQEKKREANLALQYLKYKEKVGVLREKAKKQANFISFKKFKEKNKYTKDGLLWTKIEKIKKIPYRGKVYDLGIKEKEHNFFADGFCVSNCGVRLLKSLSPCQEIENNLEKIAEDLLHHVPAGLGKGGKLVVKGHELDEVLKQGAQWAVKRGFLAEEEGKNLEEGGCLEGADPTKVSPQAKKRGEDQIGTLGSGNHFLEVQKVVEIFDEEWAKKFGLFHDQITLMVHSGSRGLGYQVATDYIRKLQKYIQEKNIHLADRELIYAHWNSSEGQDYWQAMQAAANFAWANRSYLAYLAQQTLKPYALNLTPLYDVAHNIGKVEEYDGQRLIIHRKGATRAFPGQPVLIPGSMGTASYVLVGRQKAMEESFGSVCHGAGRTMSRHAAMRQTTGQKLQQELKQKDILVRTYSMRGLAEEAPFAYKDIDEVVNIVSQAGLAKKVAKLKPLIVIKGD